jgi:hypothetical protein
MKSSRSRARRAILAAAGALCVVAVAMPLTNAAATAAPKVSTPDNPWMDSAPLPTAQVVAPFDHAITIRQAVDLAKERNRSIVGVRVQNPASVAAYIIQPDFTAEQFDAWHLREFGTMPQAVGWIIEKEQKINSDGSPEPVPDEPMVTTSLATFSAPTTLAPSTAATFAARSDKLATDAAVRPLTSGANRWKPNLVEVDIEEDTANRAMQFRQYALWSGGNTPAATPSGWGMEFGVDLYNGATGTRNPFGGCPGDFRRQFIAANRDYSWAVTFGSTNLSVSTEAYADYNDLFDSCGRNSIAVGLRHPERIPAFKSGRYSALVSIRAPRGTAASSRVGGDVQLVDAASCLPGIALTDCMGIGSSLVPSNGADMHRATLGEKRKWVAKPNRCWISGSSGTAAPLPVFPLSTSGGSGCFVNK